MYFLQLFFYNWFYIAIFITTLKHLIKIRFNSGLLECFQPQPLIDKHFCSLKYNFKFLMLKLNDVNLIAKLWITFSSHAFLNTKFHSISFISYI
jgi:hypothetical protein